MPGILQAGEVAENDCEVAILALHGHSTVDHDFGRREQAVYETCTWEQFRAFNSKVTERYQYDGDGREHVDDTCRRPQSAYEASLLCETSRQSADPSMAIG